MNETETATEHSNNPESTYLSFANPNYCFEDQVNFNLKEAAGTNNAHLTLDKLSLNNGDVPETENQDYPNSDYSSAEATPSSPDRSFILRKLNSSGDDDDDVDDDDDDDTDVDDDDEDNSSVDDEDGMQHNLLSSKEDVREEAVYVGGRAGESNKKGRGILGYLAMLEAQARERGADVSLPHSPDRELDDTPDSPQRGGETDPMPVVAKEKRMLKEKFGETEINSPDSNDSGIQSDARSDDGVSHAHGPANAQQYAVVDKQGARTPDTPDSVYEEVETERSNAKSADALPPGWEKHEDEDGPYYWHIKSGTIQRDPPPPAPPDGPTVCTAPVRSISLNSDASSQGASSVPSTPTSVTSNTERHLQEFEGHALQYAAKSLQSLVSQPERRVAGPEDDTKGEGAIRFAVRSLGWVRIAEEDLTPERSSKAVNKCIVDLSLGRNDINDAVGRWGDGKDLYMDIDSSSLRLLDPSDGTLLNSQPIHSIRVWGVGRDNGRDFAYVARDRMTRMHMCHVFQCDTPARQIANTLRDICKRIMQERGLQPAQPAPQRRPTDLPNLEKLDSSFPTPMEEPRKVLRCHYLGSHEVIRPTGVEILNEAVDWMYYHMPPEKWTFVNVAVAPSTITITEHGNPDNILEECRVRFMSFMGISVSSVKLCAFIMHTAQNKFLAHVFHCEPSAGPLCKTIEAACKLRYQKCLDAHPQAPKPAHNGKSVSAMLKAGLQGVQTIFGLIKNKTAAPTSTHS